MPRSPADVVAFLSRWPRRLAAVCCLLLAGLTAFVPRRDGPRSGAGDSPVAVATRALSAGATLSRGDVTVARWPRSLVPAGTEPDPARLVGRTLAGAVSKGEPLTGPRLVGADLAAGLPRGRLAVPVPIVDANAAALIRVGDRVDLLAGPPAGSPDWGAPMGTAGARAGSAEPGGAALAAGTIAAGVLVLAVLPAVATAAGPGTVELIVAAERGAALRVAALAGRPVLAVRADHP